MAEQKTGRDELLLAKRARRQIYRITPEKAGRVIAHERYWTTPFLSLYLDKCDEVTFEDPLRGRMLGAMAPELARRIPIGALERGFYGSEAKKTSWLIHSFSIKGSCFRRTAPEEAEAAFTEAQRLAIGGASIECLVKAELLRRYAAWLGPTAPDQAIALVEQAIQRYLLIDSRKAFEHLANALILRGNLLNLLGKSGLQDYGEAINCLDSSTKRGVRTLIAALNNIGFDLTNHHALHPASVDAAYEAISAAKKASIGRFPKLKLLWVEGRLWSLHGAEAKAERVLLRAREGLSDLPIEFALISVDLALFYAHWNRLDAYQELVSDTEKRLRETSFPILEALAPWKSILPPRELAKVRQAVSARRP